MVIDIMVYIPYYISDHDLNVIVQPRYECVYYQLPNGSYPVKDFIDQLDIKTQAKLFRQLNLLSDYGPQLMEPHRKYLKDGIFELRIIQGSNHARILYFFVKDSTIILTNGFIKKTNTTPQQHITKAMKYKTEYLNRY